MSDVVLQKRFSRGDAGAGELQQVVDEVLAELEVNDGEVQRAARTADLDLEQIRGARVEVREGEQGACPVLTTILVTIAVNAGTRIAESLWDNVIWPRIVRRLGATAVSDEVGEAGS